LRHCPNVHITFTGTGTFIVRLLQSGLIRPHDLARKYRYELHANEIVLLAYYVAAINIEETYHSLQGGNYVPFDGIVLTDTFQMFEDDDELDDMGIFQANNDRVVAQKERDIRVIIGNPPYSKGQTSGNDDNANNAYPTLDGKIRDTYARRSTATNKNNLYDSYIRAIRWASDRIGDSGIVAYVSNGGYIDGNTADGVRLTLIDEFTSVYIFNLRGNTRTTGERARKEGGQIFGSGSRATIAIALFVKNPDRQSPGQLYYYDIGDYLDTKQKLAAIRTFGSASTMLWKMLEPSPEGDWTSKRRSDFAQFIPIGEKDRAKSRETRVFSSYSPGLQTNRDAWAYGYSREAVASNMERMISNFNSEVERWVISGETSESIAQFVNTDSAFVKWTGPLTADVARERRARFDDARIRTSMYRPYSKQNVYFDAQFNHRPGKIADIFPDVDTHNTGIYVTAPGSGHSSSLLMVDSIPDLALWGSGSGQFFPRYTYRVSELDQASLFPDDGTLGVFDELDNKLTAPRSGWQRVDNVTDSVLTDYRQTYGPKVSKDDIFFYVYGLLHSPEYRVEFEDDLSLMLPRIPKSRNFTEFAAAGRELSRLHLNYETVDPYPLTETALANASLRVTKMRYAKNGRADDKSAIIYNDDITLSGIPAEAHQYKLGSRSALDWIVERYQVKTDKASGIVNDPNAWGEEHGDPRYILDLIKRITTVSVETVNIIGRLPPMEVVGA
jgi:predicted helicase